VQPLLKIVLLLAIMLTATAANKELVYQTSRSYSTARLRLTFTK
jgi:hypothetical protein